MDEPLKSELESALKEPFYMECWMRRVPMLPLKPQRQTMLLFIFVFTYILTSQALIILPCKLIFDTFDDNFIYFYAVQDNIVLAVSLLVMTPIVLVCFILCVCRDPGYLVPEHNFLELLSKLHPADLCADCKVLRTPRSRHCTICNRCVERFDHHCPWLNNCVGVNNNNPFLVFLITLTIM